MTAARELPSGTATFLFTDIEGSTRLLQQEGDRYRELLDVHRQLLRAAFAACEGREVLTEGDAFFVVFASASKAVTACVNGQRALTSYEWPENATIRVRMGLHAGEATLVGEDYVGLDVHRAARIAGAAHGEQVLLSESVRALVERSLPDSVRLRDLGEHRLKDLARPERLYQLDIEGLRTEFPPVKTLDNTPNNLPLQLTSFIGRDRELAESKRLLDHSRLLTLTGPGGTGKTRLSLQLAAESAELFRDGVYFVRLSPLEDAQLVPSTIAQTLNVQESGVAPEEQLLQYLRDKQMLLLLDNFEQLLEAAPLVGRILGAAAAVKVLTTSRAPLRVYGEQEYQVPPLDLPDPSTADAESLSHYDAVRLFIERATAAKSDFQVTNQNAPAVAAICARLDGLPLAIELAAARTRLLSPQAMLSRLEHTLEMLSSGARDLPARQQTLRGAIAWSYDLLDEGCRRVFARFGVFVGGANVDEAEQVCGPASEVGVEVFDGLATLVEQSVVRQSEAAGEPRFWMLVTIREFALEKLSESGEADAIRDRHAQVYSSLARSAESSFAADQKRWLDRLELDHDNLRAALDWLADKCDGPAAMRLAASLWRFWQMRGHVLEGRRWLERVLELPCEAEDDARLVALEAAGGITWWQGDMAATHRFYQEALELTRKLPDKARLANAIYNAAFPLMMDPETGSEAAEMFNEALTLFRELGDKQGTARALWGAGNAHYFKEPPDYDRSVQALEECVPLFRQLGDSFGLGWALHTLGLAAMRVQRDFDRAHELWREALDMFAAADDVSALTMVLDDFSELAVSSGNRERALRLGGAVARLRETTGVGLVEVATNRRKGLTVGKPVNPEEQRAWNEGAAMSREQAVDYARSEPSSPLRAK